MVKTILFYNFTIQKNKNMALDPKTGNLTFLSVKDGKIFKKDDPGEYGAISGKLVGIFHKTEMWEGQEVYKMNINIQDEDTTYVIPISRSNRSWIHVCGSLIEGDPTQDFRIEVSGTKYETESGTKIRTGFWVKQRDVKGEWQLLPTRYSKENSEKLGLPEWKKIEAGRGKIIYDRTDQEDFVIAELQKVIDNLKPVQNTSSSEPSKEVVPEKQTESKTPKTTTSKKKEAAPAPVNTKQEDTPEDEDDLPF